MENEIKAVFYGLGPIGQEAAKIALKRGVIPAGAIDIDPAKKGNSVSELLGSESGAEVIISDDAKAILAASGANVALHCTSSKLADVKEQLLGCVEAGINVISTTEELSYPYHLNAEIAKEIDEAAKKHGVTVLGTGINPGFLMDSMVVKVLGVCEDVKSVKVGRVVDAGGRREPLQRKVGAGMDVEEFKRRVEAGTLGHAGSRESVAMIADALGWKMDRIEQSIEPMVAERDLKTQFLEVKKGRATGIKQIGRGFRNGEEVITLDLRMYVGAEEPHDTIKIDGNPKIENTFKGGVHGDVATVAVAVNAIPAVIAAQPGLLTMKDLAHFSCWGKG
ncbi:dihydrodipicolinate reductase [Candidatus Micrarchaeota archaeon]|nr:dihydrodipicolinate reductase [Candidatus Micrarchaeota archaeon]